MSKGMESSEKRNALFFVLGESLWGFQTGLVAPATVLTVLLLKFNAEEKLIGLITSIEGLFLLPQIIGMFVFRSERHRKRNLVIYHLVGVIPFISLSGVVVVFSGSLPQPAVRWLLLFCHASTVFMIGVIISVWMDWLAHLFRPDIRGTIMGISFCGASVFGAGASILSGRLIEHFEGVMVYAWLYIGAGVIAVTSLLTFLLVDDGAEQFSDDAERLTFSTFWLYFRQSIGNRAVQCFLFGRILQIAGFCIIPFVALFFKSTAGGELPSSQVITCGAGITIGVALFQLTMGWVGDKRGHLLGLWVGVTAQIGALVALLCFQGITGCWIVYFLIGISMGSGFLSHSNLLIDLCPHDFRLGHITAGSILLSFPIFLFPVMAGFIADSLGLQSLFLSSLVVSCFALCWLVFMVKDPRQLSLRNNR